MTQLHLRVLLVGDNKKDRLCMLLALESAQIVVAQAGLIEEGMRHIQKGLTDVVVVDMHMRGGRGYDLVMWLWYAKQRFPLVMISADFSNHGYPPPRPRIDRPLALLAKPFTDKSLLDAIRRVTAFSIKE